MNPGNFIRTHSNFCIDKANGDIEVTINVLAPNISFDYYKISNIQLY